MPVEDHSLRQRSLRRAMKEYVEHYHTERNHQGKGNVLLFQRVTEARREKSAAVSRAARWALALLPSTSCVNRSAARINLDKLASGPRTYADDECICWWRRTIGELIFRVGNRSSFARVQPILLQRTQKWSIKRRTKVEGTQRFGLIIWPYARIGTLSI